MLQAPQLWASPEEVLICSFHWETAVLFTSLHLGACRTLVCLEVATETRLRCRYLSRTNTMKTRKQDWAKGRKTGMQATLAGCSGGSAAHQSVPYWAKMATSMPHLHLWAIGFGPSQEGHDLRQDTLQLNQTPEGVGMAAANVKSVIPWKGASLCLQILQEVSSNLLPFCRIEAGSESLTGSWGRGSN